MSRDYRFPFSSSLTILNWCAACFQVKVDDYEGIHSRWHSWFNNRTLSDVVFESNDGRTFHCHKLVLAAASPYFKNRFASAHVSGRICGRDDDHDQLICVPSLSSAALEWVLKSCYTGDGDLTDDNVVDVLLAARMYGIKWISDACIAYLEDNVANAVATFEYSRDNERWQLWTVPETKWYYIVAAGAKARDGLQTSVGGYYAKGGRGAVVSGAFQLEKGAVLHILTGSMPHSNYQNIQHLGGGGGTFVSLDKKSLVLAAGGGGGINAYWHGTSANTGENGFGTQDTYKGGVGGGNGESYKNLHGGGLGWNAGYEVLAKPTSNVKGENGGFGGGGKGCGGGGGYSGGSVGNGAGAGGGGSFVSSKAENVWKKVASCGDGRVSIWEGKEQPTSKSFHKWLEDTAYINSEKENTGDFSADWNIVGKSEPPAVDDSCDDVVVVSVAAPDQVE